MLALAAGIVFAIAAVLNLKDSIHSFTGWLFVGLALLAFHFVYSYTPWRRTSNTP